MQAARARTWPRPHLHERGVDGDDAGVHAADPLACGGGGRGISAAPAGQCRGTHLRARARGGCLCCRRRCPGPHRRGTAAAPLPPAGVKVLPACARCRPDCKEGGVQKEGHKRVGGGGRHHCHGGGSNRRAADRIFAAVSHNSGRQLRAHLSGVGLRERGCGQGRGEHCQQQRLRPHGCNTWACTATARLRKQQRPPPAQRISSSRPTTRRSVQRARRSVEICACSLILAASRALLGPHTGGDAGKQLSEA